MLQTNKHNTVHRFYNANTSPIRTKHSNNGGVDILKLYTNHLQISILLGSDPHYLPQTDPYQILDQDDPPQHQHYPIASAQTHEYLKISVVDQLYLHQHKYKSNPINTITHHDESYNTHGDDNDDNNHNKSPHDSFHDNNIPIRNNTTLHNKGYNLYDMFDDDDNNHLIPNPLFLPLKSKPSADDVVSADEDDEYDDLLYRLHHLRSPKPYIQPTDQSARQHAATETKPRRSARLTKKTKSTHRHQPLVFSRRNPYKGSDLKNPTVYTKREQYRQHVKHKNVSIIDNKPYEHAWNRNLLMPKYHIPILDDYGPMWDESLHVKTNLIRFKQWNDPVCFALINFLDTGNKALVKDLPKYIQRYVLSGRFILNNNKILCFRHTKKGGQQSILQMVPASLIKSILQRVHGKLHHGSGKMRYTIIDKMQYWWPKMRHHIHTYCRCCNTCQHIKPGVARRHVRGKMKLFIATKPFELISVDIVGPLPTSHSGNRYIVSMIDKFSRYCMLVPVLDITALSTVKAIDKWITTFGPLQSMLSDNGPQFISSMYRDYMSNHGDIKYKYPPLHPKRLSN